MPRLFAPLLALPLPHGQFQSLFSAGMETWVCCNLMRPLLLLFPREKDFCTPVNHIDPSKKKLNPHCQFAITFLLVAVQKRLSPYVKATSCRMPTQWIAWPSSVSFRLLVLFELKQC